MSALKTFLNAIKTPQAKDDFFNFTESQLEAATVAGRLELDVLGNDLGGVAKTLWSLGAQTSTGTVVTEMIICGVRFFIENGKLYIDLSGDSMAAIQALGTGEVADISLDYTMRLSNGTLSTATANIDIAGVNDAPEAVFIPDFAFDEDSAFTYTTPAFTDVDGDALTYTATLANGDPLPSWLSFNPVTRTFSGQPPENFNGTIDLKVVASDGSLTATSGFKLVINPVNDAPTATPISDQSFDEDTAVSFTFDPFTDVDGDALTYSATLANGDPLPSWLSFDPVTRTFSGQPPENFNGAIELKVVASDGSLTATSGFKLVINPVNDAPTATPISDQSFDEDTAVSFTFDPFTDMDGDALTYSATLANGDPLPSWLNFDPVTRTFSGQPPENFNGAIELKVVASDGSLTATSGFKLVINPVNDAPTATPISDQSFDEDTAVSFTFDPFTDVDGYALTYTATLANGDPLPSWLSFDPVTRTFSGQPPENFNGTIDLKVVASDGSLTATSGFKLVINPVNDAPTATPISDQSFDEDTAIAFDFGAFSDVEDATLTYTATLANGDPLPSWLSFDSATRSFTGTPPQDFFGVLDLKVVGTDSGGKSAFSTFKLTIRDVADARPLPPELLVDENDFDGGAPSPTITGTTGNNQGPNAINGTSGDDIINLLTGNDTGNGSDGADTIYGQAGNDLLNGGAGIDTLYGGSGNDRIFGDADADRLYGGSGDDQLNGLGGSDTLVGGLGKDTMAGGDGADVFVFNHWSESKEGLNADSITDFQTGSDRIDLRALNVNQSAVSLTGSGTSWTVKIDVNGDGQADMQINVTGQINLNDFWFS